MIEKAHSSFAIGIGPLLTKTKLEILPIFFDIINKTGVQLKRK